MDHFPTEIPIDEKLLSLWWQENNRVFKNDTQATQEEKDLEEAAMIAYETIAHDRTIQNLEFSQGNTQDEEGIVEPKSTASGQTQFWVAILAAFVVILFIVFVLKPPSNSYRNRNTMSLLGGETLDALDATKLTRE